MCICRPTFADLVPRLTKLFDDESSTPADAAKNPHSLLSTTTASAKKTAADTAGSTTATTTSGTTTMTSVSGYEMLAHGVTSSSSDSVGGGVEGGYELAPLGTTTGRRSSRGGGRTTGAAAGALRSRRGWKRARATPQARHSWLHARPRACLCEIQKTQKSQTKQNESHQLFHSSRGGVRQPASSLFDDHQR